ncbi:MAG: helix-turn-helix domain-containing protein [Prevotella sp.]|nr:helix-turn-helix domain-containing protein [Prevotella sp.]
MRNQGNSFWALLLLLLFLAARPLSAEEMSSYYTLGRQQGLSSNCVYQMLQLRDGRMVVVTDVAVDIYDGRHFSSVAIDTTCWMPLPAYTGETHLFVDSTDRLWMKQRQRICSFDLRTMQQRADTLQNVDDFFIDARGESWLLHGTELHGNISKRVLHLPADAGALQDLEARGDSVYTFFSTGCLAVYQQDGQLSYLANAYGDDMRDLYTFTSLVVRGFDDCFYQVRTGTGGSILLSFDTRLRQWRQLLTSAKLMHTLTATPTGWLYLTTPDGYLRLHAATGEQESFSELHLPDGSTLSTGINTVWLDREGGIWLGTYNSGVLYTSPLSGLFDTRPIDIEVHPILTTIFLHGQPLVVGKDYDGHTLLDVTPPYADRLTFSHDENSLAFLFSTMNYVRPRSTCYRYRFSGDGGQWHTLSADSTERLVDDEGVFYLPLVGLSPGEYTLEVMATTNPHHWDSTHLRTIHFTIRHPWWQSPVAYLLYVLVVAAAVGGAFIIYRHRLQRKSREDMLLLRIQNLVEQVNQYEHTSTMVVLGEPETTSQTDTQPEPTQQEKDFMSRATQLVEQHLADPAYGVEQLAADLYMERTGLYKKLTALMQQPPVAFIRSIRLHRAADLLQNGDWTIAEIAEHTGFSSPSYFSKCFQKEFGCKPSEYSVK